MKHIDWRAAFIVGTVGGTLSVVLVLLGVSLWVAAAAALAWGVVSNIAGLRVVP